MAATSPILTNLTALFGNQPNRRDKGWVSRCQESPNSVTLYRAALGCQTAELIDYFEAWDQSAEEYMLYMVEHVLAAGGR